MQKILSLICNLFLQSGNLPPLFLPFFGVLLHAGEFTLFPFQFLLGLSVIPRIVRLVPIAIFIQFAHRKIQTKKRLWRLLLYLVFVLKQNTHLVRSA